MKRLFFFTTIMACALFALVGQQNKAEATNNSSNSPDWSAPVTLSNAPQGATGPHLAASNNGQILLVYTHQAGGGSNPYYRLSTNNGVNWTAASPVHNSGNNSTQVYAIYDNNNLAHAVWIENNNQIRHARQTQWAGNTSTLISISATGPQLPNPVLDRPKIAASGSSRLDMVWAEANEGVGNNTPDIYHTHSTNNGQSWQPPTPVALTNPSSLAPAVAVGNDGKLHVVWAEGQVGGSNAIAYVQGTPAGGTVNWTTRLIISDALLEDSNNPQVTVHNGVVNVFFTYRIDDDNQYINRITCATNCTASSANWNQLGNPISGARLGANTQDPFNVASAVIAHQGCLYSYFHGTSDQYNENSELIWGVNSCNGWAASAPDRVTLDSHRSMFPTLASQGQWLLLAYESGLEGSNRQIEFRRALVEVKVYLPIIFRG
jgi:hypothetical protein